MGHVIVDHAFSSVVGVVICDAKLLKLRITTRLRTSRSGVRISQGAPFRSPLPRQPQQFTSPNGVGFGLGEIPYCLPVVSSCN